MPLDGRILQLSVDVTVEPPVGTPVGESGDATKAGEKLTTEIGLLAQRLFPGCKIQIGREIIVF